jgi:coproporphyrinogen III oxidase
MQQWYDFVTEVGNSFIEAYVPIVSRRKSLSTLQRNATGKKSAEVVTLSSTLVHDKGTLFGLKTNGRIESILMSLPAHVQWRYNHTPTAAQKRRDCLRYSNIQNHGFKDTQTLSMYQVDAFTAPSSSAEIRRPYARSMRP